MSDFGKEIIEDLTGYRDELRSNSSGTDCSRSLLPCVRDTDGDGDCHRCAKHGGCPLSMFRRCHVDAAITDDPEQIREFKRGAERFEYREWLGIVRGWRHRDGRVLVEQVEPFGV